jgi:zinc protease
LKNGLKVICIEKKTSPIIFFSIWYNCGGKNDAISKSGVAHYLEHMAFCLDKMEFTNFLEDIGARNNAFTHINTICFHETIPKEHIETVFFHESKRMKTISFDKKVFLSEKGAILEERSMRYDNDPDGAAQEAFLSNVFNREIGGIGVIGWRHEIESIQPRDLQDFHDKWFAPNNATIVIAGDFDLEQIKTLIEKYFGSIPSKRIPKKTEKNSRADRFKEVKYGSPKNGSTSSVKYLYRTPFSSKENLRKSIALEVAVRTMNQPAFFIKKTLKDVLNNATSVSFIYIDRLLERDFILLEISARSIDDLRICENMLPSLINKLVKVGVSEKELEDVKRKYLIELAYKKDDIEDMSYYFGWLLICGYSIKEIQLIDDMVQSITKKECDDLIKEVFSQKPFAVLRVEPKGYDRE